MYPPPPAPGKLEWHIVLILHTASDLLAVECWGEGEPQPRLRVGEYSTQKAVFAERSCVCYPAHRQQPCTFSAISQRGDQPGKVGPDCTNRPTTPNIKNHALGGLRC